MKKTNILLLAAVAGAFLAGCGPSQEQINLQKAMSARMDHQPTYNQSAQFLHKYCDPNSKDYVMWVMDYTSLCLMGGNYDAAQREMLLCYKSIALDENKTAEFIATVTSERNKLFKGEPFERAMLCCYLGLTHYMQGDYNNARIFFAQADIQNSTKLDNMKDFRHDFQLGHYWLGRAYMKLGDESNAAIAFKKASQHLKRPNEDAETNAVYANQAKWREQRMRLEQKSYAIATDPKAPVEGAADMSASPSEAEMPAKLKDAKGDNPVLKSASSDEEFFSAKFQKDVNLILFIETGMSPIKYLTGPEGCMSDICRAPYNERKVMVYLDGHKAGPAVQQIDLFHQAACRGWGDKDTAQVTKGLAKTALKCVPYASMAAGFWDVSADSRYWSLLPGEVHIYAAKVKPGLYTLNLQSLDANNYLLPRYSQTTYNLPVKEGQENIYMLHIKPEADNCYGQPKNK